MKVIRGIGLATIVACVAMSAGVAQAVEEGWHFELIPYLWLVNVDGSVSVGDKTADFSADFNDVIDKVDLAGELKACGSYNHFVCFAQGDYFSLVQDFDKGPGGELNADMTFLAGTVGYRFDGPAKGSTIDVMGGARFLWNRNEVEVNGLGSNEDTSQLLDGIVMMRANHPLTFISEKLRFAATVSVGAGDSDVVWELQPELGYQFTDRIGGRIGYRRIEYEYNDGPADVDVGYQGFLVGLSVKL